ncbi:MAG: hypothetical protein KY455_10165, partial [Euryarchaeota archaeon]|nr:hypothetical protein [Euryarchaeota archaeon]
GILTADAAGRAKMGAGFIIESLLGTGCVTDDKVATGISPTKLSAIACMAIKAAAENIATANWTSVALDGADVVDTDAMHDPAVNNTRVTVPYAGKYLITGTLVFAASATGHRRARVRKNGAGSGIVSGYLPAAVTEVIGVPLYGVVELAANDYLELQGFQNSGGGLDTYGTTALTDVTTHLSVTFLGA